MEWQSIGVTFANWVPIYVRMDWYEIGAGMAQDLHQIDNDCEIVLRRDTSVGSP